MKTSKVMAFVGCVCLLIIAVGCTPSTDTPVVHRNGEPDVLGVSGEDVQMNEAIAMAQRTLDGFALALENPQPNQYGFSVKVRLEDGAHIEHIWLSDPVVGNESVSGTIGNEPLDITGFEFGQSVEVPRGSVSDWMYVEDEVLKGGVTIRLLRDRMPPEEKAAFDASVPFLLE